MDALKIISEGSIKAEKPQFNADGIANVELRLFSLDAAFRNNLQCVHF